MSGEFAGSAAWLRGQWSNPSDIFTILLIIGGDIVRVAVAQLSAGPVPYLTPVSFSFGWVSYAVSAMLSAVGENRLMPKPELDCIIINAKTGYARQNCSWVLSRMLRDFDFWRPRHVVETEYQRLKELRHQRKHPKDAEDVRIALRVSVWQCLDAPGKASGDFVYWVGVVVAAVQIGIAAVPWALYDEWLTFMVTTSGTVLAFASGALPQWKDEKIGVRKLKPKDKKDVFLTEGNGAHDAILILGCAGGLDLEALASPFRELRSPWTTRVLSLTLAVLWVALLISVAGWQERTWYIVCVGMIGLVHNVVVAGTKRQPQAFGIHLKYQHTIAEPKVMQTLWKLEEKHPKAGRSLVDTFFPGKLFPRERRLWEFADNRFQTWKKSGVETIDDWSDPWREVPPLWRPEQRDDDLDIPLDGPFYPPPGSSQTGDYLDTKPLHHVIHMDFSK